MRIEERIFQPKNNFPVHYRFKIAGRDCRHLLIVMSGFNNPDPTIYDFSQSLSYCDSHILWIKDDFDGLPAYYLCNKMSFEIEENISQLINGVKSFLNVTHASIIGASKGGSVSLYYGIKHRLDNIVSIVPQFNIGSYVANGTPWEHVGLNMMGEINEENICHLDSKLIDMVSTAEGIQSHVYLFTSPTDHQYNSEILPNIDSLSRIKNFNFILSKSILITQHNEVAGYNMKLLLALIYQFEHGISPQWGMIHNGGDWVQ